MLVLISVSVLFTVYFSIYLLQVALVTFSFLERFEIV